MSREKKRNKKESWSTATSNVQVTHVLQKENIESMDSSKTTVERSNDVIQTWALAIFTVETRDDQYDCDLVAAATVGQEVVFYCLIPTSRPPSWWLLRQKPRHPAPFKTNDSFI